MTVGSLTPCATIWWGVAFNHELVEPDRVLTATHFVYLFGFVATLTVGDFTQPVGLRFPDFFLMDDELYTSSRVTLVTVETMMLAPTNDASRYGLMTFSLRSGRNCNRRLCDCYCCC